MSKLLKEDKALLEEMYQKYLKEMPKGLVLAWKAIVIAMMQSVLYDLPKEAFQKHKETIQRQIDYIQSALNDISEMYEKEDINE